MSELTSKGDTHPEDLIFDLGHPRYRYRVEVCHIW